MLHQLNNNNQELRSQSEIKRLRLVLKNAKALVIGAGSGLSTAAGYIYTGERLDHYFSDFKAKYGFSDLYSGGFYPFPTKEEFWAYWSRYIWINRYAPIPNDLYTKLLKLASSKDYFVITTNVDHCFQRVGFEKDRLFYTQGDYGLFQSSKPSGITKHRTYDNKEIVKEMLLAQGFSINEQGELIVPNPNKLLMQIPSSLIPYCPDDQEPMTTNLRADDLFVEDQGWFDAAKRYEQFLREHTDQVLFLELGVGANTPGIIKYPFWQMVYQNNSFTYACINLNDAFAPTEIQDRSIVINQDLYVAISTLVD